MSTSKKNIEKKNEQRAINEAVKDSYRLPAQLQSMWFDHKKALVYTDSKGAQTDLHVTKMGAIENYLGMKPHYVIGKDGQVKACKGYTPAEFNAAVCSDLQEKGTDGKVKATYVYRDRVVQVELFEEGDEGSKRYSLFEKDEAEKKAKGESGAKSIKVYSKVMVDEYGWGPKVIKDVLYQSRHISDETKRAQKSRESYEAIEHVYVVMNVNGMNKVVEVEKPSLEF